MGIRGLESLTDILEDDDESEEEKREREARNTGTALGVAAGVIAGMAIGWTQDEDGDIEEDEDVNTAARAALVRSFSRTITE